MSQDANRPASPNDLRRRAEKAARTASAGTPENHDQLSPDAIRKVLHDLRVHQIELEMQNEELQRAQEEIEISRARYVDLYDLAPVGYLSVSEKGLILGANLTFALMLGLVGGRGSLAKKPLTRFISSDDQDIYYLHRKSLFQTDASQSCELRMVRTDGSQFWVRLASTVSRSDGEPLCLIAVSDITERKRAEEGQAKLREEVNQAQKMETVGRLAGGVAHDLNNLLTPILGYSELLLGELGPGDVRRESVGEILRAAERARDLVRQLLNFSRRQLWSSTLIDLNQTAGSFATMLRRTVREDIAIEFIPAPASLVILGDANQLGQVIVNLGVNAQDAMLDGGVLTIATSLVDVPPTPALAYQGMAPGRYALLTISDTGRGMDAETKRQIFEPFFTTKAKGLGTGLGLATVYTIVKQHGGSIAVRSEPGQGSTFELYFAVVEGQADHLESARADVSVDGGLRGTERILLVEDNPQVRDLTQAILERLGYTILAAENAQEALEMLNGHDDPVHLVLSDVVMPGMKGPQLVARIAESHPHMKALLMSGYTDDVVLSHGAPGREVHFLQKPFTLEALALSVREALDA